MNGAIVAALNNPEIEKVYAGMNGISGILKEKLFDLTRESKDEIERIPYTPGAIFGSCRKKLKTEEEFKRLFEIFEAHNIGYFLYNGGNDSMETVHQIAIKAKELGYDLKAIGIPKTVDNDLMHTDHCPGYGSAAKFTAISILEATRDLESMHTDSTQVFILESMGRYAGWLAASGALANMNGERGPQIFLLPEVPFDEEKFLSKVEEVIARDGYCSIVLWQCSAWQDRHISSEVNSPAPWQESSHCFTGLPSEIFKACRKSHRLAGSHRGRSSGG